MRMMCDFLKKLLIYFESVKMSKNVVVLLILKVLNACINSFLMFFLLQNRGKMPRGKATDAKPRGRMTAYAFFVQTCREEHKKKHPDENVIFAEFSKKCAERWKVSVNLFMLCLVVFLNVYPV